MKTIALAAATIVLASGGPAVGRQARADSWPGLEPGPYVVGYEVRLEHDHSRTFRPERDYYGTRADGPITRPVRIHVWFNTSTRTHWASYDVMIGFAVGRTSEGTVLVTS